MRFTNRSNQSRVLGFGSSRPPTLNSLIHSGAVKCFCASVMKNA